MDSYRIRKAVPEDAAPVAADLRPSDVLELQASLGAGFDPLAVLSKAIADSDPAFAVEDADTGVAFGLFGVAPTDNGIGVPWLLATPRLNVCRRGLVRYGKRFVKQMRNRYPVMVNFLDARNDSAMRWLSRIGFDVRFPVNYGAEMRLFYPFGVGDFHV